MSDLHVRIEVTAGPASGLSKAIKSLRESDPDFPQMADGQTWWHKPPDNARAIVARRLSRYGLTGRLSVVEHAPGTEWNESPPAVWSGFTAATEPK